MNNIKLTVQEFVLLFGIEWAMQQHFDFLDLESIETEAKAIEDKYTVEKMSVTIADIGFATERFVCSNEEKYFYYDIDYIWEEGYELEPTDDGFIIMEECFPVPTIEYKNTKELEYAIK